MKGSSLFFWLLLATFAAVPTAIALVISVPRYRQSRALEHLHRAGFVTAYGGNADPWLGSNWGIEVTPKSDLKALPYLADLIDINYLQISDVPAFNDEHARILSRLPSLYVLTLKRVDVGDAGFAHLRNVHALNSLELSGTRITGRSLEKLRSAVELQGLDLNSTAVTDADLAHVAALPNLVNLRLSRTHVGDAGLAHLARRTGMIQLDLHGTRVTDKGMVHLKGLTHLYSLYLGETSVTGAGLRHIAGHPLGELFLNGTPVDDAALAEVAKCLHLTSVKLARTRVTDAGMRHLASLRSLEGVVLSKTQVGDRGAAEILRGCKALKWIRLSGSRVTNDFAAAISAWPHGDVDVSDTAFSEAGYLEIRKFTGTVVYTKRTVSGAPGPEVRVHR